MRTLFLSLSFVALNAALYAENNFDGPLRVTPPAPKAAQNPSADIRVNVAMTLVPVTVMDSYGRNVLGLEPQNFRVFDGSQPVPIATFSQQDAPVSVGLIYDCSRSMTEKFKTARSAPEELYRLLNPQQDETFLITVSDRANLRQEFTSEFAKIQSSLLFTHPTGVTPLLDGVVLGLDQLKHAHNPRKALIIVSDGGENNSRYTLRDVLSRAVEADTQVFVIGLYDDPQTQEEADGPELLSTLAAKTGGVNFVIRNVNDMRDAMAKVGATLHNQYVLGYYPPQNTPAGKYRPIKVQLMVPAGSPPLQVYARAGYFAPGR